MHRKYLFTLVIIVIFLTISQAFAQTPSSQTDKKLQTIDEKIQTIEKDVNNAKATKEYFGYVITIMTVIITAIIVLFAAVQWWQMAKSLQSRLDKKIDETTDNLSKEFQTLKESNQKDIKELEGKLTEIIKQIEKSATDKIKQEVTALTNLINKHQAETMAETVSLRAQIYRTFASQLQEQKSYDVAFVWWIRSADNWSQVKDTEMAKTALSNAIECLNGITSLSSLEVKYDEEMLRRFNEIKKRDNIYNGDIAQIEKLYNEKRYSSPPPTKISKSS